MPNQVLVEHNMANATILYSLWKSDVNKKFALEITYQIVSDVPQTQ